MKRLTQEEFINRAIAIHGDKYDYSKTVYVNSRTKVCIICKKCGCEFWQAPSFHITRGDGCPMCNPRHKMNTEEFIQKAVNKHGDKYDYSLVKYIDAGTKVKIICRKHGVFEQTPAAHIAGQGCPKCKNEITSKIHGKTQEEFLRQAIMTHGDKYNYSNVVYKGSQVKVCIKCNICGKEFWQTPDSHVNQKQGCPNCAGIKRKTTESFLKELESVHGDRYATDKVSYVNMKTPITLTCRKHGDFSEKPYMLMNGHGCPICEQLEGKTWHDNTKYTKEDFVRISKENHKEVYDYTESVYVNCDSKIKIKCPNGHVFWQVATEHMHGTGCPFCNGRGRTTEEFVTMFKEVHGDKYILDKTKYINSTTKVCVTCKEHGDFYALPHNLLNGQGCPQCNKYSKGEERIERYLKENDIKFIAQKEFPNESLFIKNKIIRVDFYLPDYNTIIEFNGEQHYKPIKLFGGQKKFEQQQERDNALRKYCKEYKINLIEIPYSKYNIIESILDIKLKKAGGRGMR